jgi:hypothetical protein
MPSPQENSNLLLQVQSIHVDEESCQQNYGRDPQTSEIRVDITRSQSCVEDRSGMAFELGASGTAKVHGVAGAITVQKSPYQSLTSQKGE